MTHLTFKSYQQSKIDWSKVVEVLIAILSLGLSHIRKHKPQE